VPFTVIVNPVLPASTEDGFSEVRVGGPPLDGEPPEPPPQLVNNAVIRSAISTRIVRWTDRRPVFTDMLI
jgi:hypothetical protein